MRSLHAIRHRTHVVVRFPRAQVSTPPAFERDPVRWAKEMYRDMPPVDLKSPRYYKELVIFAYNTGLPTKLVLAGGGAAASQWYAERGTGGIVAKKDAKIEELEDQLRKITNALDCHTKVHENLLKYCKGLEDQVDFYKDNRAHLVGTIREVEARIKAMEYELETVRAERDTLKKQNASELAKRVDGQGRGWFGSLFSSCIHSDEARDDEDESQEAMALKQ